MNLAKWKYNSAFDFFTVATARLQTNYARELLADEAIASSADFILFIDDDMMVPKDLFYGLIRHADSADIMAPLCFQRVPPYNPVLYTLEEKMENGRLTLTSSVIKDYPKNGTFYADSVGFGVALIKTEVLKKVPKPWFFSNSALGEDIFFCLRAKKEGFKLLIDTRIKVGHMASPHCVTELDFIRTSGTEEGKIKHAEELSKHFSEMTPLVEVTE